MQPPPRGFHKRFDRLLKDFAEEAPRMFLHLLGIAPLDADVQINPLPQETAPPVKLVDFVAVLIIGLGKPFVFHVEFQLDYHADLPSRIARYGSSLSSQYNLPVVSIVLLLRPDKVPEHIPKVGIHRIGKTRTIHPFAAIRVWEIDPAPILASKDPHLLPWAVLMKSDIEQVRLIAKTLNPKDDEAVSRFLTLGSLRYDKSLLETMLGGPKMGFVEAFMEGSSLVKEAKDKANAEGRKEGHTEGRTEGRTEEARHILRQILKSKFPGLESLPAIDQIQEPLVLERLLIEQVFPSDDRDAVQQAILHALPNLQA